MGECSTCDYADRHGWFGPGHRGTHCRGCHRSWTGLKEAHCRRCHRHFSTPNNFDLHLTPKGCAEPGDLRSKAGVPLLRPVERASGAVWVGYAEREIAA